jgi:hypothetical protein
MPTSKPPGSAYQPLVEYLAAQSADAVTLSFAQIEALIRRRLPASAYLAAWWTAKDRKSMRFQNWRAAGWEATTFVSHEDDRQVTFQRWR